MTVQYQIDGNIFYEIKNNWLCASVNQFLVKARQVDIDQTGNTVEHVQLNDGRVFTRLVSNSRAVDVRKTSNTRPQNILPTMGDSITRPR
jgi:hypothetical protein